MKSHNSAPKRKHSCHQEKAPVELRAGSSVFDRHVFGVQITPQLRCLEASRVDTQNEDLKRTYLYTVPGTFLNMQSCHLSYPCLNFRGAVYVYFRKNKLQIVIELGSTQRWWATSPRTASNITIEFLKSPRFPPGFYPPLPFLWPMLSLSHVPLKRWQMIVLNGIPPI